jgi:hypothetical protein
MTEEMQERLLHHHKWRSWSTRKLLGSPGSCLAPAAGNYVTVVRTFRQLNSSELNALGTTPNES